MPMVSNKWYNEAKPILDYIVCPIGISCTDGVCKPPEAAVFKRYGAEHSGKRSRLKRDQVSVKKLNESKPFDEVSKRLLVVKSIDFELLI